MRTEGAVLHISTVHRADDARIYHRECVSLVEAGYSVDWFAAGSPPDGIAGVVHHGLPQYASRIRRMLTGPLFVAFTVFRRRPDLVHLHDPELFWLAGLVRFARLFGGRTRVIVDVHEDFPAQVRSKDWIPPVARNAVAILSGLYVALCARASDAVVVAGEDIRVGAGSTPAVVLRNYPKDIESWRPRPFGDRSRHIVYAGLIAENRCIESLLSALCIINEVQACHLDLFGPFASVSTATLAEAHPGWKFVRYHGTVPHREALQAHADARVGLLLLNDIPNHQAVRANKLFELMMVGTPVVAPDFGEWRDFLATHQCGESCDVSSPSALSDAILRIMNDRSLAEAYGRRGRECVVRDMNWNSEKDTLLRLYTDILA